MNIRRNFTFSLYVLNKRILTGNAMDIAEKACIVGDIDNKENKDGQINYEF